MNLKLALCQFSGHLNLGMIFNFFGLVDCSGLKFGFIVCFVVYSYRQPNYLFFVFCFSLFWYFPWWLGWKMENNVHLSPAKLRFNICLATIFQYDRTVLTLPPFNLLYWIYENTLILQNRNLLRNLFQLNFLKHFRC